MNLLKTLERHGQSFWLDDTHQNPTAGGSLNTMIHKDNLKGLTLNSGIIKKVHEGNPGYQNIVWVSVRKGLDAYMIYEFLPIRAAADALMPVYRRSGGKDGYVSLDVPLYLVNHSDEMVHQARCLWQNIGRPNLMINVPATIEGISAIRQLISEEINVNATMIFSEQRYRQVSEAYLSGLEELVARGGNPANVASVASIVINHIDTAIDDRLNALQMRTRCVNEKDLAQSLLGKGAIANAKLIYLSFLELHNGQSRSVHNLRWHMLEKLGARPQRLLWASTGVQNPRYGSRMYVEELIGEDTIITMTPTRANDFRDHGIVESTLDQSLGEARNTLDALEQLGISLKEVTEGLLDENLLAFQNTFDQTLDALAKHSRLAVNT